MLPWLLGTALCIAELVCFFPGKGQKVSVPLHAWEKGMVKRLERFDQILVAKWGG